MKLFTKDETRLYVLVSRELRAKAEGLSVAFSELPAVINQTREQTWRTFAPMLDDLAWGFGPFYLTLKRKFTWVSVPASISPAALSIDLFSGRQICL